ncbi:type II toxin-antitoxin system prevent-host-death family antitoxin (plasmid) [Cereibacter azotoformans]|uniref:Antitoxin n=2 Tax=Cereibacter TaxID=1653176 RepID=A0A2T5JTD9_9RHOB|nr:type II toxin-antitoxin system prevent-host-death family antitoxin [Cereibacter azotoformans]AXQ96062.1 type II toxin-antitoxin system prevent-host-death family antitoxin [Cereibacter sphaeroides]PTR13430.1 antitoxin YefM [Cereibacter azotoformans]UIJ32898.1 type II toxin-antitoxin system prevent-host-death family antitoxin [Cereibacter azotoformans]ULB12146.1 type II toxin-antitoxin system prevent-host-death family antitoxin [Cereibacter azotoformans]
MNILTYTDARKHLKSVMDSAIHDKEETVITRAGQEAVVVVGKEEWDAIQATLHLLSSPVNAARLRESIAQLNAGQGTERDLIEDETDIL